MAHNPDVYLKVNLENRNCDLANLNYPNKLIHYIISFSVVLLEMEEFYDTG